MDLIDTSTNTVTELKTTNCHGLRDLRRTPLFDKRLSRLRTAIHFDATCMIVDECRLVFRAYHGDSRLRVILFLVGEGIRHRWDWYVVGPVCRLLCRLDVYHSDGGLEDDQGRPTCVVCERPIDDKGQPV